MQCSMHMRGAALLGQQPKQRCQGSVPSNKPCTAINLSLQSSLSRPGASVLGSSLVGTQSSSPFGGTSSSRSTGAPRARSAIVTHARRGGNVDIPDRALASVPYLIPLFDGLRYGKFALVQFPILSALLSPLDPLIRLYFSVPFSGIVFFLAVYAGIANNQRLSRFVRFNAMQSILLDIILIVPGLIENIFRPPMGGPALGLYINAYNTIFLFVFACVAYAVGSCLIGQAPCLPLVADAADQQVR